MSEQTINTQLQKYPSARYDWNHDCRFGVNTIIKYNTNITKTMPISADKGTKRTN